MRGAPGGTNPKATSADPTDRLTRSWLMFRGKLTGFLSFLGIAALLLGGLGWATRAALRVEEEQRLAAANARAAGRPVPGQEGAGRRPPGRPLAARHSPRPGPRPRGVPAVPAVRRPAHALPGPDQHRHRLRPGPGLLAFPAVDGRAARTGCGLHFQIDQNGWTSPQVIPDELQKILRKQPIELALNNVTPERESALKSLRERFPPASIMTTFSELGVTAVETDRDAQRWAELQDLVNASKVPTAAGAGNSNYLNHDGRQEQAGGGRGGQTGRQPGGPAPVGEPGGHSAADWTMPTGSCSAAGPGARGSGRTSTTTTGPPCRSGWAGRSRPRRG